MATQIQDNSFYWQTARDSLLTPAAITMFEIAIGFDGVDFDTAKAEIDRRYESIRGVQESQRHGGNFQTFINVFEESGWIIRQFNVNGTSTIRVTDAGRQAHDLIKNVPDFLKAIPYFLLELFSRYQLNNPSGPNETRNRIIDEATRSSNIFPYWTIWKIMRECSNQISSDELRRFVFQLKRTEDIDSTINQIMRFRNDINNGVPVSELNIRYPAPLEGAVGEPKYIMARAGIHIGNKPPVIVKPDNRTYELNDAYLPLIDEVLANEPVFRDFIDNDTWTRNYGKPVEIVEEEIPFIDPNHELENPLDYMEINDENIFWKQVNDLIVLGCRNILFVGPPGTSKTTFALAIGAKLVDNQGYRFQNIQFHQSFSYEDFIEGYVPDSDEKKQTPFVLKDKVFVKFCKRAYRDPDNNYVLIIDELNRGEPSRIFGDTLTYIERRNELFQLSSGNSFIIPNNLIIIATMNPIDKSIADLDMALDRRFEKIQFLPDKNILRDIVITKNGMDNSLGGLLTGFFEYLSRELDNRIGHAYFKDAKDISSLRLVWSHKVLPLIEKELRFSQEKLTAIKQQFDSTFPS